jgi:regulator of protease activity HflC (stomatin/prohibitin superfamily)
MKKLLFYAMLLTVATSCTRISPGSVGIKVNQFGSNKGVMDATECTGTVWYAPWKYDIYEFPLTIQHKEYIEDSLTVNSQDGSVFGVAPVINYSVKGGKVVEIFTKYKKTLPEIEKEFIKTAVYEAFRIAANSFTADSLVSNRESFEIKVRALLVKQLDTAGFIISQFTSGLKYPPSYETAIEDKNKAVQKAQQAENEVRTAEANAKIQKAEADGNYYAIVKAAEAQSRANQLLQSSLTPLVIQQQYIDKWNGVLPVYSTTPQLFKDISK